MATNPYFNNFPSERRMNNEHMLMEDVIDESIKIMGHSVYYIPRESFDSGDMILGEYAQSKFEKAYLVEAYIANVEGFEGDGDFFSKFGLEIRDTSNFILSRRAFSRIMPTTLRIRPQEGDLVWVPVMHRMFEIKFIEKKLMFFSLGNREPFVYEMRCEDFRYSQEAIDTGVTEIDDVEAENAYTMKLNVNTAGTYGMNYIKGEVVYQSTDGTWANNYATAEVGKYFSANGTIFLYGIQGAFSNSANLVGNTSLATFRVTSIGDEKGDYIINDLFDNQEFKTETDSILDLSETNPFGVP